MEYQILESIPGIGKVYASGILAEIGSIRCFKNNDALAKYCGIVWKENQSGNFQAEDTPMKKAGNRYLRYYMVEAADSVIRNCPEYRAFYNKKFALEILFSLTSAYINGFLYKSDITELTRNNISGNNGISQYLPLPLYITICGRCLLGTRIP